MNNSRIVCLRIYVNVVVAGAQLHVIITYSLFNGLPALNETIENYSKSFLLLLKKSKKYPDRAMGGGEAERELLSVSFIICEILLCLCTQWRYISFDAISKYGDWPIDNGGEIGKWKTREEER